MDAAERDQLIHTALYDTAGESVEGAFVDYFVYYADTAREDLVKAFQKSFTEDDARAVRAAIRQPDVPTDAGAQLVLALRKWLPDEAEALRQSDSPELRAIGMRAVKLIQPRPGEHHVWLRGLDDSSPLVRRMALRTLLENHRTLPEFSALLRKRTTDTDPNIRRFAATSLGFYEKPENQVVLARILETDPDPIVRNATLRYLAEETRRLGVHYSPEKVAEGIGEELVARLIAALEHPAPEIRTLVARALERVAAPTAAEAMVARLQVETDHDARCALLYYPRYREVADTALPLLLEILHNQANASQQTLAAWLLPAFGADIEPDMIGLLSSENELGPRRAAAMGLGSMGSLQALPPLLATWRDPAMKFADRELQSAIRDVLIRAAYGAPPSPPTDLASRIQRRIDALEVERHSLQDHCKTELGALLAHATLIYLWAIRPDGIVLWIDHEAFTRPSEPETEPLKIFVAWVHAAEKYPELAAGIPQPQKGTEPCKLCRARGYSEQGEHCFTCSGIGWTIK